MGSINFLKKMIHSPINSITIALLVAGLLFTSCGGGGGGGGGSTTPTTGQQGPNNPIKLLSIQFPKDVAMTEMWPDPPDNAPLSQQIVFTFSGPVQGAVTSSAIEVVSKRGENYDGPLLLLDSVKDQVVGLGEFEVFSNIVVFTPILPKTEMNLTSNAQIEEIAGLLPDRVYSVNVLIGTTGAISNLVDAVPGVNNVEFITTPIENLYFENFPAVLPKVTSTKPLENAVDFPINDLKVISGLIPYEEVSLEFDTAVKTSLENLNGKDQNGDGIIEPNLFMRYTDKELYVYDSDLRGIFRLDYASPGQVDPDTFKLLVIEGVAVPIQEIAFTRNNKMVGLSEGEIYSIPFNDEGESLELTSLYDTGLKGLKNLVVGFDSFLYSIDQTNGKLVSIDLEAKTVTVIADISNSNQVVCMDTNYDGELYWLRVEGMGGASQTSYIESIDPSTGDVKQVAFSLPGYYSSMTFFNHNTCVLFDNKNQSLGHLNLENGAFIDLGEVSSPFNTNLKMIALRAVIETDPKVVSNGLKGSYISIEPCGILPIGANIEVMVRNDFANIRGYTYCMENPNANPLGARYVSNFNTIDLGAGVIDDVMLEDFLTNDFESIEFEIGQNSAIWNYQDNDGKAPIFQGLVATFGLGGSGELGNFKPSAVTSVLVLDTDYQKLPLHDGSTPDITAPTVVTGGKFNFNNITIPETCTIYARGSHPLVFTATGDVEILGSIDVSGKRGGFDVAFDSGYIPNAGGDGGPGAGRGGHSQPPLPADFISIASLQSPPAGEAGKGPPTKPYIVGGRGGQTSAFYDFIKGSGVNYAGPAGHSKSRGAGAGGGTMLWDGLPGRPGKGNYYPDEFERKTPTYDGVNSLQGDGGTLCSRTPIRIMTFSAPWVRLRNLLAARAAAAGEPVGTV